MDLYIFADNTVLCCQLVKACPKEPENVPFKEIEIDRVSLVLGDKLGAGNFGEVFKGDYFCGIKKECDIIRISK